MKDRRGLSSGHSTNQKQVFTAKDAKDAKDAKENQAKKTFR